MSLAPSPLRSTPNRFRTAPAGDTHRSAAAITPWRLLILGAVTALGPLSIDLYLPAFPELAAELGTSQAAVQLTLTACVLGLAVGQLVVGPLSDAIGRRLPIAVGMLAWSLASLACALAPSIATLTMLRFSQGLAGSAGVVVARAMVRDATSGDQLTRAFARLMLVVGVVPIAAPTLGGLLLQVTSWRGIFVALALVGSLITLVVVAGLRESLPVGQRRTGGVRGSLADYRIVLRDARFIRPAIVLSFTFAALFTYVASSSFVLREVYALSSAQFGLLFGVNSMALVIGTQVSAALARRVRADALLGAAIGLAVFSAVILLATAAVGTLGFLSVAAPLFVIVFAVGAALPVASSSAMNGQPERAGTASALIGVFQFTIGGALAPVVGAVGTHSVLPLALVMTACLLVALAIHAPTYRRPAPQPAWHGGTL